MFPRRAHRRRTGCDELPCRTLLRLAALIAVGPFLTACPQLLKDDFRPQGTEPAGGTGGSIVDPPQNLPSTSAGGGVGGSQAQDTPTVGGNAAGGDGSGGMATGGAMTTGGEPNAGGGAGGPVEPPRGGGPGRGGSGSAAGADAGGSGGSGGSGGAGGAGGGGSCEAEPEHCDGRDNDCDEEIDEDACLDTCSGFSFEGHGYRACDAQLTAEEAQAECEADGMYLVEIESKEENDALVRNVPEITEWTTSSYFGPTAGMWIGATADEDLVDWSWERSGVRFWRDDHAVPGVYSNWGEGQPNNTTGGQTCAGIYVEDGNTGSAGEWNDGDCQAEIGYICEAD